MAGHDTGMWAWSDPRFMCRRKTQFLEDESTTSPIRTFSSVRVSVGIGCYVKSDSLIVFWVFIYCILYYHQVSTILYLISTFISCHSSRCSVTRNCVKSIRYPRECSNNILIPCLSLSWPLASILSILLHPIVETIITP